MATQATAAQPRLPSVEIGQQLVVEFVQAFESVQEQYKDGIVQPVVPLTQIASLGHQGLGSLKKLIENFTGNVHSITVDAGANSVTFTAIGPMPPAHKLGKHTSPKAAQVGGPKEVTDKVARPANAFIIYRGDWHARTMAENPGFHNNDISKIIGAKWRNESEEIRAAYKKRAGEVKRQHELENPNYQYQPRKPSEKKRRMTKNKIAKLAKAQEEVNAYAAAQQSLPDVFDPVTLFENGLKDRMGAHPTQVTTYGTQYTPQQPMLSSPTGTRMDFESGPDSDDTLRVALEAYNNDFNNKHYGPLLASMPPQNSFMHPAAAVAQKMVNGHIADETAAVPIPSFPIPMTARTQAIVEQPWAHDLYVNADAQRNAVHARVPAPHMAGVNDAEVDRQTALGGMWTDFVGAEVGPTGFSLSAGGDEFELDFSEFLTDA